MADHPLREASDPTAHGERLENQFRRTAWRQSTLEQEDPALAARLDALIRNPAMPLSRLARVLRLWGQSYTEGAWHSPSVPLLRG